MELAPIKDVNEQTEDELKLVAHVRSKVEESRASANRIAHEGIWMTNIAYLCGYNNLKYNTVARKFEPVNRTAPYVGKPGLSVNKILPTVQNRLARLCKNPPKYDVRPESNDQDDKDAARLSLQVLQALWDKAGLDQKRIGLYMWAMQCGHSYMKVCWDDTLGPEMPDPDGGISYAGDIRVDTVSAFEIFPDPLAKSWDEAKRSWIIQAKVRKLDYFKAHYPDRGEAVKEEETWLLSNQYEQRINSLNVRGPSSGGTEAMKNSAVELIKYEARSSKYPQGRMIVTASGVLLRNDPLPVGEIPFEKFDDVMIAGKYYPESIITHLVPIQDAYNDTVRRRSEWTRKLLAGKYHAFRGTNLSAEALNDQNGEVIFSDVVPSAPDGGRPTPMQIPMIPQYAYLEEERLEKMIDDIAGISQVSRGELPAAGIPAIGMQLLTEQDDTRIGVETEQHEHAWAGTLSLVLKYVGKYYKTARKLKVTGKSGQYLVNEIEGGMLREHSDVIVIRGSTLPGSKTLRRQEILNAWQQGLLGDPADPKVREKVLEQLEFGDVAEMWESTSLVSHQIKRGIDQIELGEKVEVSEFDNHPVWINKLNDYRVSDKFLSLPPEGKEALMLCLETHVQYMVEMTTPPQGPPPLSAPQVEPPPGAEGAA